ncbi:hypothetical protein KP509_28G052800 [Ceratopteris richardii]|uniref:mitogen-activated protein kinase n=1 Tax=Ceratopteris richardii TaxID=49495 RepID=A0A8T2RC42_CERRI|nr:hypothetical protein KP509_28G052800 [Ceratopteris richardii]KAH7294016.1 hypothetical protein KP509_28G052800 [Ceratopteris richardii]
MMVKLDFFTEYGEASRYQVLEVIGKGSYGLVCSAIDSYTGEKVAIKKINDVFEHVSDAIRILREIKILRFLRHPDIVQIKHILLPPSPRDFKDVYVVFELMEADLYQVIKANDDLTSEHFQFFLYQLLRALKFIHSANIFHRDLKPKNVLANSDCKLKLCDFGLARVTLSGSSSAIFWTDYVATRWYRAPELCGSFYAKYTTAIDIWSIGCIFGELLTGKPLFPGKNVVHQLDLITDLLGTPSAEFISGIRNDKAKRYLTNMRKKKPVQFEERFPNADPSALQMLKRLLAFDAKDRPTAEEALADPYFAGLSRVEREPFSPPASKTDFDFERKKLTREEVQELIYREILEYHPEILKQHLNIKEQPRFTYPSGVSQLRKQFDHLQKHSKELINSPIERKPTSLPRERISAVHMENVKDTCNDRQSLPNKTTVTRPSAGLPKYLQEDLAKENRRDSCNEDDTVEKETSYVKKLVKSVSASASQQPNPLTRAHGHSMRNRENNKQDEPANEGKGIQPRVKSMGSTVAKMVAAFTNGTTTS